MYSKIKISDKNYAKSGSFKMLMMVTMYPVEKICSRDPPLEKF